MANSEKFIDQFVKFINSADPELGPQVVSPDARFFVPFQPEPLIGPDGYQIIIGMLRSGFSDVQWHVEDSVGEGDSVAIRFTMRGTHNGTFMGVPPTGRPIAVQAINFYKLADGKIVEEFGQPDMMGLMMQIGAIPPP